MLKVLLFSFCLISFQLGTNGQDHSHMHHNADSSQIMADTSMPGMDHSMHHHDHDMARSAMSHALSLNLPMTWDGSGTSWLPDATPMYGHMIHTKGWMFMFHGNIFIRYNKQDITGAGSRGGEKWDAPNMLMAMGQTRIGQHGLFHFNAMFSLDALITGGSGYPLLFQTGESWKGVPLVDRQHPHDLFSELSVSYAYAFSKKVDLFLYVGYPGEPALGPTTFMHRPSGMDNPDAPIGHHWTDATHITFGVATLGLRYGKFKLEGSSFTGREPDENRYNFDKPRFDSWSGRLSFNPGQQWAMQVSHGYIKSPEALHPDENVHRTTASATYVFNFGDEKYFSATGLWGMNKLNQVAGSNNLLFEGSFRIHKTVTYFREEWVQKTGEELNLDEGIYGKDELFPINALTVGGGYDVLRAGAVRFMLGGQFAWYHPDARLASLYGQNPLAFQVYLRIYPSIMKMHSM
ncbi:MAG: hypothetical protein C5B59_05480 [Bacteroidetes bacterium]|nr:MAG: hypothetical protein C5B59_05480 [Bacteroidota bacterium]